MPNRIIKNSIRFSEKINALTDFQFRLWVNLILYVDDFGRGDARPAVIKSTCFPLRQRITNKDIEVALCALAGADCIELYEIDGRSYLRFPNWESHQRVRSKVSKCPAPDVCQQVADICQQVAVICQQEEEKNEKEKVRQKEKEEIEEDKESNLTITKEKPPFSKIKSLYLEICVSLPAIRDISGDRQKAVSERWYECGSIDTFRELFTLAEKSSFLKGENKRGWTADFDWLMANFSKVLEHKYDDKPTKGFNLNEFFELACRRKK